MTDYILVPVEPTLEMMEAGAEGCGQDLDRDEARGRAFVAYKAMLAAAPDHIADARKMVSRQQIREVFLRNGFTIKPGCDDLADYVYKAAFELLELAAPDVQAEPVGWQFYQDGKWWNGDDRIKDLRKNTEAAGYPVRDVYAAQQPAEQQPVPVFSDEDHVCIPRGLIAAACSAIGKKRDAENVLSELRRYTLRDLSRQTEPDVAALVEALETIADYPWHRDHEMASSAMIKIARAALAAHRKGGDK